MIALTAREAELSRQLHEALDALARIVSVANLVAHEGPDGFVAGYDMPVGPIHAAIPLLTSHGIVVNLDGTINGEARQ